MLTSNTIKNRTTVPGVPTGAVEPPKPVPVTFQQCVDAYEREKSVHRAGLSLGVCGDTVHKRLRAGGFRMKKQKFSVSEDALIVAEYRNAPIVDLEGLAKRLDRPKPNVCRRAKELGCETKVGRPMTEKSRATIGRKNREWIKENGHPRGALGIVHSAETKAVISKKSYEMHLAHKSAGIGIYSEELRQASSDRMMKYRATVSASESYSRCKRGVREDIGPIFFRSKWEANYARYLNWLQARGEIDRWEYEPETFWFEKIRRGVRSYTPDFKIFEKGNSYFVEVKGWLDPKSKTKLKRMAKYHPKTTVILFGEKDYRSLSQKLGRIIPNWE